MSDERHPAEGKDGPSIGQLRAFLKAREANERAQAAAKITAAKARDLELEIHEAMVWAGWKGEHKIDLGAPYGVRGFTAKATETGDVYDEDDLLRWAKSNGRLEELFGDRQVRKRAVNALAKRAKRGHAELPAGVEPVDRPYLSVRDVS